MWWLILCVNVTRLRDAQIAGTILFLGVFVRVLLEGVSIWIRRLSKNSSSLMWLGVIGPEQSEGVEEGWTCSFCSELRHHPLLSLPTGKRGSQPFGLGSYTADPSVCWFESDWDIHHQLLWSQTLTHRLSDPTRLPGSSACRQQTVALLGLNNHMSPS